MQLLRKLLFPYSLIYGFVVYIRNFFYDKGLLSSTSFNVPTICIGNLSVGGTGKTPMTEFLIGILEPYYKIAVLSRGYKRKSAGFVMADETTSVEILGDEPFQIHQKFPNVSVAVDVNRREGIRILFEKIKPDIIVLDDAYQHRKVTPDYSILLTSYGDLYVEDWYLPTGNLRDSKIAAHRANLIIVTKCPSQLNYDEQVYIRKKINPGSHQKLLFSYLEYENRVYGDSDSLDMGALHGKDFSLVTGIANPLPLIKHLDNMGLVFEHLAFKDHHFFTEKEIDVLQKKKFILTTEKDYVRLQNRLPNLYYLPIKHKFLDGGDKEVKDEIMEFMKGRT